METLFYVALAVAISGVYGYLLLKTQKANDAISRGTEERLKRQAETEDRRRIYEENYRREGNALKKRVLDDLKAIARGERQALSPDALTAAIALQARQGDHPEIVKAWAPVIEDLRGEITDAKATQDRLEDLLYPETLEDVEELEHRRLRGFECLAAGKGPDPDALEAVKALNEIRERDARKKREEREAEALKRRQQKEKDAKHGAVMGEMARSSAISLARLYGFSENMFDGLSHEEMLIRASTLRELREFADKPFEERERILRELEAEDRTREEGRSRIERG